jgi:hypothetical protein
MLIISVDKFTEEIYTEIKSTEYSLPFYENTQELSILRKYSTLSHPFFFNSFSRLFHFQP